MKKNFLLVILGILFFAFSTRTVAEENCKVTVADYSKICITLTYGDDIRVTDVETEKGKLVSEGKWDYKNNCEKAKVTEEKAETEEAEDGNDN